MVNGGRKCHSYQREESLEKKTAARCWLLAVSFFIKGLNGHPPTPSKGEKCRADKSLAVNSGYTGDLKPRKGWHILALGIAQGVVQTYCYSPTG